MTMKRNVELLQQTMQYIKDHPERHQQDIWTNQCGTAACFAGWAAMLSGWAAWQVHNFEMWTRGANLLGLTYTEARILFDTGNTAPMLELMVKDLVNGDQLRDQADYHDAVYEE